MSDSMYMMSRISIIMSIVLCSVFTNAFLYSQDSPTEVPYIAVEQGIESEKIAYNTGVYQLEGIASYYADKFHKKITANGETFNMNGFTAAHRTLPFNTVVEVTNTTNGRKVTVRINDRGPYLRNRVIDLSKGAAEILGIIEDGTANVSLQIIHMGKRKVRKVQNVAGKIKYKTDNVVKIQIASYKKVENAKQLVKTLAKHNFKCSIERYDTYFRVVIDSVEPSEINTQVQKLKRIGFHNIMVKDYK